MKLTLECLRDVLYRVKCNFDEVWSKREDERHDVYKLSL
jgi:hypothetical protein